MNNKRLTANALVSTGVAIGLFLILKSACETHAGVTRGDVLRDVGSGRLGGAPTLISIQPNAAPNDLDTRVIITGTSFEAAASVQLDGTSLDEVTCVSSARLEAIVPWGLDPGVYTLTVVNPGGESGSLADAFTVTQSIGAWATGGPYGGELSQIAIHTITPTTVYAAAPAAGIFRSRDGADSWETIWAGAVEGHSMAALAVAADPDILYLQAAEAIYRSDNSGDTWSRVYGPTGGQFGFFPHPVLTNTVYAAGGHLYRSDDRGEHWITLTTGLTDTDASALAFAPTDPLTMVLGTSNGNVFRSTDGGASWTYASRPLENIWQLTVNPYCEHEVWATVDGRFGDTCATLKSANGELTAWTKVSDRCAFNIRFAPLGWGPAYSQTVLLAAWGGILRSSDGGASWTTLAPFAPGVALHPLDPAVVLAAGGDGVERSLDGGGTWAAANQGLTAVVPWSLAVVPGQIETLYADGTTAATILKSDNGGESWAALAVPASAGRAALLVDPFLTSRVYVWGDGPVHISNDGGQSWPLSGTLSTPPQYAHCGPPGGILTADPVVPGVLLAGASFFCGDFGHMPGGFYRSTDYGEHWAWLDLGLQIEGISDLAHDPARPHLVYAAANHTGVLRSADGGLTWQPGNSGIADPLILSVAVEPVPPHRVFAHGNGCYVSADDGLSWSPVEGPPHALAYGGLLFAPGDPPVLYAATDGGLYREVGDSLDSLRWQPAAGALGRVNIASLAVGTDGERVVLYAGTSGATTGGTMATQRLAADSASVSAGVYRYTLPPLPLWEQANTNGFGDPGNFLIGTLDTFEGCLYAGTWRSDENGAQVWRTCSGTWSQVTPSWSPSNTVVYDAQPFGSYLYFATGHDYGGAGEIWRTNGTTWEPVVPAGFGDGNNTGINALAVFDHALYAATTNYATGLEVWRSPSGEPGSWTQVNADGFGGSGTGQDVTMEAYGVHLYVGLGRAGLAELWRSEGSSWTPVFTDGLAAGNTNVSAMAEFDGALYIALRNVTTGGEVWRSGNGLDWVPLSTQGLGNPDNGRPTGLYVMGDDLYLVFSNLTTGAEVWRTGSGGAWWPVNESGWGDPLNGFASYSDKSTTAFRSDLYVATANDDGGEVWRLPLAWRTHLPIVSR